VVALDLLQRGLPVVPAAHLARRFEQAFAAPGELAVGDRDQLLGRVGDHGEAQLLEQRHAPDRVADDRLVVAALQARDLLAQVLRVALEFRPQRLHRFPDPPVEGRVVVGPEAVPLLERAAQAVDAAGGPVGDALLQATHQLGRLLALLDELRSQLFELGRRLLGIQRQDAARALDQGADARGERQERRQLLAPLGVLARASALPLEVVLEQDPVDPRLRVERAEVERIERVARLLVEGRQARVARGRAIEGEAALQRAVIGCIALDALAHARVLGWRDGLRGGAAGAGAEQAADEGREGGALHVIPFLGTGPGRAGAGIEARGRLLRYRKRCPP